MKNSSVIFFTLTLLSQQAYAGESFTDGMEAILIDQTYRISKISCISRDPRNSRLYKESWGKWEDENREALETIGDVRLAIENKFEQLWTLEKKKSPSEMEKQAFSKWLRNHDLILARMQADWDKLSDDELKQRCESIIEALTEPMLRTAPKDALVTARRIFDQLQKTQQRGISK